MRTTNKKIVVIGKTGRQSAICLKLAESNNVERVYFLPGNTMQHPKVTCVSDFDNTDYDLLLEFVKKEEIDYIVTGNGSSLSSGIVDFFKANDVAIFGPSKTASRLEWSKEFGKEFMKKYNIPSAKFAVFEDFEAAKEYILSNDGPYVIKADGLVGGIGVFISDTKEKAIDDLKSIMVDEWRNGAGKKVVIEEFLVGPEVSVHALVSGSKYKIFPLAQDHKPLLDGNKGENTGGMGSYTPCDWVPNDIEKQIEETIVKPTIEAMLAEGIDFSGCLFPGIMITKDGPKCLEYNTRFGSPEMQSFCQIMDFDLDDALTKTINGDLENLQMEWKSGYGVTVNVVTELYPQSYTSDLPVTVGEVLPGVTLLHNSAKIRNGTMVTDGGIIFSVASYGDRLDKAIGQAYDMIEKEIYFDNMYFRKDIGSLKNEIPS